MVEPGLRLAGRYRLVERLDGGGAGEVWHAWDQALSRPVAVKVPGPGRAPGGHVDGHVDGHDDEDAGGHEELRERVLRAVRVADPAFVTVYDCDRAPGSAGRPVSFIVTAFLDGETLAERVRRAPLPVPAALECCAQTATALAAAHAAGVAHGDLRMEKIFYTPDGVRIVDLGLGVPGEAEKGEAEAADVLGLGTVLAGCLERAPAPDQVPEEVLRLGERCRAAETERRPGAAEAAEVLVRAHAAVAPESFMATAPFPMPRASGDTSVLVRRPGDPGDLLDTGDEAGEGNPGRLRDRVTVMRVAVTVTLLAASLATIMAVTDLLDSPGERAAPPRSGPAPVTAAPDTGEPESSFPRPSMPDMDALERLGELQPIVEGGRASGAIRSDVALDLDNTIGNMLEDLASGRTSDAGPQLQRLREKIATRARERALDKDIADRMTEVLARG
ncbi:serine/threonine-protein kinase [Actinomadura viridis]